MTKTFNFNGASLGTAATWRFAAACQCRPSAAQAAHALGADPGRLEDALAGRAHDAHDARETNDARDAYAGSGLREDQAAAALAVLTDGRLVSVINAPAGAGKTRVLAEAARIWTEAGLGPVIGITPSQSARNTLAAGVSRSYNAAQFLGHLPGRRGAGGPVLIGPAPCWSSTRPRCCPARTWLT